MAIFIVSYDLHNHRDYDSIHEAMGEVGAVKLLESVWGVELNNTPSEVREWMQSHLDEDDSILVVQIKPRPSWATRKIKSPANDWLKQNI